MAIDVYLQIDGIKGESADDKHKDIVVSKLADLATPILLQTCSSGKTIPKAKLEFLRADGQGERVKYFEIELENVLIGSVSPNGTRRYSACPPGTWP